MKKFLLFSIGFLSINCFGQDFSKLLDKQEIDSLDSGFEIIRIIDKTNCKDFYDFHGTIEITKIGKEFKWHFVGKSSKFNMNEKLISQYNHDSIGQIITYQEFDENGKVIYDCTYDYKTIKDNVYRLEHIRLYYEPNSLRQDGWRYLKIKDKNGKYCNSSSQHKYGKWVYYMENGTVEKTKDYGEIK